MERLVILGGGHAAAAAVSKIRSSGFTGKVDLISAEPVAPYQRPPLSKKYLLGEMSRDQILLKPERYYHDHDIGLHLGVPARVINRDKRIVELSDGGEISFDRLLIATGARPRALPPKMIDGNPTIFPVRTLDDVDRMAGSFDNNKRVLVIGGGYIGLEAAAVAAKLGFDVTLVEAAPRILQRVACSETSDYFRKLHTSHGVAVLEDTRLETICGTPESGEALLGSGKRISFDFAICGIGIIPETDLASDAGLIIDNGISVDSTCRTSDPDIFAAGDCASFEFNGRRIRLESVQNANDQGEIAAMNMIGGEETYRPVPWFWSDQFDTKLQIA
ncbi:MAG: FAD-dependent oxidoreductase, partial [Pseudomonadota bacterium]